MTDLPYSPITQAEIDRHIARAHRMRAQAFRRAGIGVARWFRGLVTRPVAKSHPRIAVPNLARHA